MPRVARQPVAWMALAVVASLLVSSAGAIARARPVPARAGGARARAAGARMAVETPERTRSMSTSEISSQMADMRSRMEEDEQTRLVMQALRGSNLNDDIAADKDVQMDVVEMRASSGADDVLPLTFDPERLKEYFSKRPMAVFTRLAQILTKSSSLAIAIGVDYLRGQSEDIEVRRAAELRRTIISLGPFFIKLGQALSIRPDVLSPRAMVELQQLCDKVPSFDSGLAMRTVCAELGVSSVDEVFSEITPEPVAAASLGQVYRARLREGGDLVAVKVQRPFVLETVSLDLHLARELGGLLRNFPALSKRLDLVELIDEFGSRFYQELDYVVECENGVRIAQQMRSLPMVVIPKNYPDYTSRRVHVAEWVEGEKLSQSQADDVGALVNLGVITYLTQLLDTGFFHADPHPGNMLRTPDGRLVILDFGLMTEITDDQKYGMIEAIAHLIHRDYELIGQDFVSLDFIPEGTDLRPIVPVRAKEARAKRAREAWGSGLRARLELGPSPRAPPRARRADAASAALRAPTPAAQALTRVFDAALAGGGAKSINFQELAADLAQITFDYPFRIPPYFALVIRAIGVLEGIALVGNPQFAIVDEAYPYISRRLLTDDSPRLRAALRYMVYGKGDSFDVERMIDLLQALEKFVAVKDGGDGSAFKVNGVRGDRMVGEAGSMVGTRVVAPSAIGGTGALALSAPPPARPQSAPGGAAGALAGGAAGAAPAVDTAGVRSALDFFFSEEGRPFRAFLVDEVSRSVDTLSRDALAQIAYRVGLRGRQMPPLLRALAPPVTSKDRKVVENISRLLEFLLGDFGSASPTTGSAAARTQQARQLQALIPVLTEYAPPMREFGLQILNELTRKQAGRAFDWAMEQLEPAA